MTTTVRQPVQHSAFAAAFLSFVLPGLGHIYAGVYRRGVVFAVLPVSTACALLIQLARLGPIGFGLWAAQTSILGPLVVVNLFFLAYRIVATVDAYRLASYPTGDNLDGKGWTSGRPRFNPFSIVGLVAVLIVMTAGHGLFGYWDVRFYTALNQIHSPIEVAQASPEPTFELVSPTPLPVQSYLPDTPSATPTPSPTPAPAQIDLTGRINILLVGVDRQGGGFRTDSMIVASVDKATHKAALFSMPRDTMFLPMPPNSALSSLWGPKFGNKLNALWAYSDKYRNLFPGGGADALKQALGYALFGRIDAIPYYVLVDFDGFENVIDTLGGVTINVPAPVIDDGYPGNGDGQHLRVYIPAGIQHMTGAEALVYARSRKGSGYYDDYNRSARQEQILIALQQETDVGAISSHLGDLIDALKDSVHTDIPEGPDVLGALIDQARYLNLANTKTYAFSTAGYGYSNLFTSGTSQQYGFVPDIDRIRAAVAQVTSGKLDPSISQGVMDEQAPIVVENGSGTPVPAGDLVGRLQSLGLNAQPGSDQPVSNELKLVVVNGADVTYPNTFAMLEKMLGVSGPPTTDGSTQVQSAVEPSEATGFVIITGLPAGSASSTAGPTPLP